jgi:hypothetical protein
MDDPKDLVELMSDVTEDNRHVIWGDEVGPETIDHDDAGRYAFGLDRLAGEASGGVFFWNPSAASGQTFQPVCSEDCEWTRTWSTCWQAGA